MCIADMAAARRTFPRYTRATISAGSFMRLTADPRRVGLIVQSPTSVVSIAVSATVDGLTTVAQMGSNQFGNSIIMRIVDYGQVLMGDLWVFPAAGDTILVVATELLADPVLDRAIMSEVG